MYIITVPGDINFQLQLHGCYSRAPPKLAARIAGKLHEIYLLRKEQVVICEKICHLSKPKTGEYWMIRQRAWESHGNLINKE